MMVMTLLEGFSRHIQEVHEVAQIEHYMLLPVLFPRFGAILAIFNAGLQVINLRHFVRELYDCII
jgi:hypothetical protein